MKFNVGDKVKFLDQSGGGVVTRIISPGMVSVAIEDGFEIPTLTSDLIRQDVDAPVDSPKHMFREDFQAPSNVQPEPQEFAGRNFPLVFNESKGTLAQGIYLAYIPHDQKWLITGMVDIYLINDTPYEILFSVFTEGDGGVYEGVDYGSSGPFTMALLESIDRENIGGWCRGVVQVLFHRDEDTRILNPGSSVFAVKASSFYNEGSYRDNPLTGNHAILVSLLPLSAQTSVTGKEGRVQEKEVEPRITVAREAKPEHIIEKHRTGPREAVVDLHAAELVENPGNLSPGEILQLQTDYFRKCLDSAVANHFTTVKFIHGVGKGSLKSVIGEILDEYDFVEYHDASMAEYGYGATEVHIRHNR
ncbi:MAG: DUF2027 domain-containing protein [Bacteroidales bacterium]|nr:DUF2027 domain-containing protein [Bacteroidales bacterium]